MDIVQIRFFQYNYTPSSEVTYSTIDYTFSSGGGGSTRVEYIPASIVKEYFEIAMEPADDNSYSSGDNIITIRENRTAYFKSTICPWSVALQDKANREVDSSDDFSKADKVYIVLKYVDPTKVKYQYKEVYVGELKDLSDKAFSKCDEK